jgi:guanylate kinase
MTETKRKDDTLFVAQSHPLLLVISGPSGAGKDTVLTRLKNAVPNSEFVTTLTTRAKRPKEKEDINYHFVSVETFEKMKRENALLESANVYGNWYGVPKEPVKLALKQGKDVIVKVDVQGVANIKKLAPKAIFIFIVPPSMEELTTRLKLRRTESAFDIALRLKTAEDEMKQLPLFDYVVVNRHGEVDLAVSVIGAIITAEKSRTTPRKVAL